jgi:hypothetical protein
VLGAGWHASSMAGRRVGEFSGYVTTNLVT